MVNELKPIKGRGKVWMIHAIIQTISPLIILAVGYLIYNFFSG